VKAPVMNKYKELPGSMSSEIVANIRFPEY